MRVSERIAVSTPRVRKEENVDSGITYVLEWNETWKGGLIKCPIAKQKRNG